MMTNHPNRSRRTLNEVEFANLKGLLTEYGHASAATIGERLSWGPERIITWIARSPAYAGAEIGPRERRALALLCKHGINLSHAAYLKA